MTEYVAVNDRGLRVGQSHHKAVLSDVEVMQLLIDRGPADAPCMSYTELAKRYGISKSGVRDILIGRRRGQAQTHVEADKPAPTSAPISRQRKVMTRMYLSLRARTLLKRMGGSKWVESAMQALDVQLRCASGNHLPQSFIGKGAQAACALGSISTRTVASTAELREVALVDAQVCAATGGISVRMWRMLVEDKKAPQPVVRRTKMVRWRAIDVVAYWKAVAENDARKAAMNALG